MKIHYLITAFSNELHLHRLIEALRTREAEVFFFIHYDRKSVQPLRSSFGEDVQFLDPISVWWAGWSHQQAILNLVQESLSVVADWHILLSGSDYPIQSNAQIVSELAKGQQVITLRKGFYADKPRDRLEHFYFDNFDRRKKTLKSVFFLIVERLLKRVYKRTLPFDNVYHGTTWWALSQDCLSYTLDQITKNRTMENFYKHSFCAEESLFHSIIGNSPFAERARKAWICQDWSVSPGPGPMTLTFLASMTEQERAECFFARKFSDSSDALTELIDKSRALQSSTDD